MWAFRFFFQASLLDSCTYNLIRMERAGTGVISGNTGKYTSNMVITPAMIGVDNAYSPYPAAGQIEYFFNNFGCSKLEKISWNFCWGYSLISVYI